MWKVFFLVIFITPVYAQVFTEDISKISHYIAENEADFYLSNPTVEGIPGDYLRAMSLPTYIDPETVCEDDPTKYKPLNFRYELLAVTEEFTVNPDAPPQTTIIVAKFQEEESEVVKKIKGFIEKQLPTSGNDSPGRFQISQNQDAGKKIVLYAAPGTNIDINSEVKAEGTYAVDMATIKDKPISTANAQIQMDVVNRISINQQITGGTEFKGSLESLHTTGSRALDSLSGTKFELSTVRAEARVDSQIDRNVHGYSQVNYTANTYNREIRAIAGFDIKAPNNAEILVFTGYSSRQSSLSRDIASRERELGIEYKTKKGVSVFSRMRDGNGTEGRTFETGIKIDLNR